MEHFAITNRWTGLVQFTAEIECAADTPRGVKIGLAVRWAHKSRASLSGADLSDASLRGADLSDASLRGADLSDADLSGASLRGASLSGADLSDADLSDADLSDASLSGVSLRGASLRGASLRDADLSGATFSGATFSGADLSGVPRINDIHSTVYAAASVPGALDMGTWHCGTAHCRAGWVVTLAGDGGKALEREMGTSAAAAMIYLASDPKLERIPNFYCDNDTALADMKRLADAERAAVGG